MKKLLIIAILFLLPMIIFGQTNYEPDKFLFAGARYDNKLLVTFGACIPIGGNFYSFNYTDVGTAKASANTDLAYLMKMPIKGLYLGPVAGPAVDWENQGVGDLVTYFVGASGALASLAITPNIGLAGMGKYKFSFKDDNKYVDGWTAGLAFWVKM